MVEGLKFSPSFSKVDRNRIMTIQLGTIDVSNASRVLNPNVRNQTETSFHYDTKQRVLVVVTSRAFITEFSILCFSFPINILINSISLVFVVEE